MALIKKANVPDSRRLQRFALLLAMLFALSTVNTGAQAQPAAESKAPAKAPEAKALLQEAEKAYQAIEADVAAGKLTRAQGDAKWNAYIEKSGISERQLAPLFVKLQKAEMMKQTQALLAAGKMTQEQAELQAAMYDVHCQLMMDIYSLTADVKEGKTTQADAMIKSQAIQKEAQKKMLQMHMRDHLAQMEKKLAEKVKAGQLTDAQAKAQYAETAAAAKKQMNSILGDEDSAEKAMMAQLQTAVKAGQITEAQAQEKINGLKAFKQLMGLRAQLRADLEAGKITQAQAKAKYQAAEKAMMQKLAAEQALQKLRKNLDADVKAGKMTQAQANKKYAEAEKTTKEKLPAPKHDRESSKTPETQNPEE